MSLEYRLTAQNTWDTIADSFDTTRQTPWSICLDFISSLKQQYVVLDLGCGNGRHLLPCAQHCSQAIGIDISQKFLHIIQRKLHHTEYKNITLIHGDAVQLPLENQSIDAVLFIASLHNIQGKEHRQTALREIARILKPQGTALISVWSRWQDKFYRHFLKQYILRNREFGDIDIFWRQHNQNVPRFYHLYSRSEFLKELHHAGLQVQTMKSAHIHSTRFPDNYFAVVKKA
ncbi:MAG TPA: methyltransferase domain-containing protein [Thermoplasmata archaeon]|nr:methyltransferase domain-containing protein [Thermoplasmata archaeon]